MSLFAFYKLYDFKKEDKEMAHKRKTVTDLEQRVGERKKKYVRYQEGTERGCDWWDGWVSSLFEDH